MAVRRLITAPVELDDPRTNECQTAEAVERHVWEIEAPPRLQSHRQYALDLIPAHPGG